MEKQLKDIDLFQVYSNWYQGTGPFRCFFRTPGFVFLKHYPNFTLQEVIFDDVLYEKILGIISEYKPQHAFFILDLPGEKAIIAAYLLQKEQKIKPVLILNHIPHPIGLIGSKQHISNLIECGLLFNCDDKTEGFVFILDQSRYGDYPEETLRQFFNNQYELTEDDFPYCEMLKELGFGQVVYLYQKEIKEDIGEYLNYLIDENMPVMKIEI